MGGFSPLLTLGAALLTAIVTVVGTIYVARSRAKVDIGSSITTGFRELTDQLQEERSQLSEIIKRQRDELAEAERTNLRQESMIRRMRRQISLLERKLEKAGVQVPPNNT